MNKQMITSLKKLTSVGRELQTDASSRKRIGKERKKRINLKLKFALSLLNSLTMRDRLAGQLKIEVGTYIAISVFVEKADLKR